MSEILWKAFSFTPGFTIQDEHLNRLSSNLLAFGLRLVRWGGGEVDIFTSVNGICTLFCPLETIHPDYLFIKKFNPCPQAKVLKFQNNIVFLCYWTLCGFVLLPWKGAWGANRAFCFMKLSAVKAYILESGCHLMLSYLFPWEKTSYTNKDLCLECATRK